MSDALICLGVALLLSPLLLLAWWAYAPVLGVVLVVAGIARDAGERGAR